MQSKRLHIQNRQDCDDQMTFTEWLAKMFLVKRENEVAKKRIYIYTLGRITLYTQLINTNYYRLLV